MRGGERGRHRGKRSNPAERQHQAHQEQQVISAVQQMPEPQPDELAGNL